MRGRSKMREQKNRLEEGTDDCGRKGRALWRLHTSVKVLQREDGGTATWRHKHPCSAETKRMGTTKKVSIVSPQHHHTPVCLHLKMHYTSFYPVLPNLGTSWSGLHS